jgi:hypothetical protein
VLFFWFGFSIHTFFSYLQGRGMAARSMSSSSRRLGAGLVMVMVVLMLALVQLHSVAGAEAAAAAGKTYTVAWNYPFQQNFYTHWNQGTSYVVGDRLSKSVVLLLLPSSLSLPLSSPCSQPELSSHNASKQSYFLPTFAFAFALWEESSSAAAIMWRKELLYKKSLLMLIISCNGCFVQGSCTITSSTMW